MPQRRFPFFHVSVLIAGLVWMVGCQHTAVHESAPGAVTEEVLDASLLQRFDKQLTQLVEERGLVGLSAGIVKQGELAWAKGYGYADLEGGIAATPDTPYLLGGCSQAFAAVLAMKLVEEGTVGLDDPIVDYRLHAWYPGAAQSDPAYPRDVLVRHVLSNTAQNIPGRAYHYAPNTFADLTWVVEEGSGLPYPRALEEYIMEPAAMERTVPGQLAQGYDAVLAQLAKPYDGGSESPFVAAYRVLGIKRLLDELRDKPVEPIELAPELEESRREVLGAAYTPLYGSNASSGLISSVSDLARFDKALQDNRILSEAGRAVMWTPAKATSGAPLPQGLGWFVQVYRETKVVWQFGEAAPAVSSLYVRLPEQGYAFIALANTDRLCAGYDLPAGDVTASPFAKLFLDAVLGESGGAGSVQQDRPRATTRPGATRRGPRR